MSANFTSGGVEEQPASTTAKRAAMRQSRRDVMGRSSSGLTLLQGCSRIEGVESIVVENIVGLAELAGDGHHPVLRHGLNLLTWEGPERPFDLGAGAAASMAERPALVDPDAVFV